MIKRKFELELVMTQDLSDILDKDEILQTIFDCLLQYGSVNRDPESDIMGSLKEVSDCT